ncbi:NADP-dependent oxidoreductase [Nonomuraea jiangxiensis]|uniref:Enoyl reductase n=1 Tax=Nonomuraea jiangxiensis TaxID=633440 RepID=A0A1G9SQZ0_9ACTN|nr:NADP-dependent oxidoreductase [Nonomuraea jiangxiensis]SDM37833.1 enoyl reductase [Nonomuraea jiangxiensis]
MARVVVFAEYGEPEVLHVIETDDPVPADDEIRIRVRAAGVQPFDALYRRGDFARYKQASFPARLGNEVAGVIDALGDAVSGFAIGDEVIAFVDSIGYADTIVAPAAGVVRKPAGMPWPEAGVLSASGQTADTALDALGIIAGDRLLIHAAAGGVGSFATQLAVARGATVVGTASERNHAYLTRLGALPVTYGPGLVERVGRLVPEGITAALDCVGGEANDVSVRLLGASGRAVTLVDWQAEQRLGVRRVGTDRSVARLAALTSLYEKGSLIVPIWRQYPLDEAPAAHREIETGHVRGKIALVTT